VRAKLADAGVSSVRIALSEPNRIAAVAEVDYQGHSADVKAEGRLSLTKDGNIAFIPLSVAVGLLPLPPAVSNGFKSRIDMALRQAQQTLPLRVEQAQVKDGQIVLTGPPKTS
jgi:hypothetical protein